MSFEGVPAIYFNSIFGNSNDNSKFIISGNKRDLNRNRWNRIKLEQHLQNKNSKQAKYYKKMTNLLVLRNKQKAFHPNASRITLDVGPKIFGIKRLSVDKKQSIYCYTNMTSNNTKITLKKNILKRKNILNSNLNTDGNILELLPFQTVWLSN